MFLAVINNLNEKFDALLKTEIVLHFLIT